MNWLTGLFMRKIDTSIYSTKQPSRITPEKVNLGDLPPIESSFQPIADPISSENHIFPEHANGRTPEQTNTITPERPNTRTGDHANARTPEQANAENNHSIGHNRAIVRHSFNFYTDQIHALKRLRLLKELDGKNINLSDLVREAIDNYLKIQRGN